MLSSHPSSSVDRFESVFSLLGPNKGKAPLPRLHNLATDAPAPSRGCTYALWTFTHGTLVAISGGSHPSQINDSTGFQSVNVIWLQSQNLASKIFLLFNNFLVVQCTLTRP